MKFKLLLLLFLIPAYLHAKDEGEVLVYKFDSQGENIIWSVAQKQNNSKQEAIEDLKEYKKLQPNKTLLVYKNKYEDLQDWFLVHLKNYEIDYKIIEVDNEKLQTLTQEFSSSAEDQEAQNSPELKGIKKWWNSVYETPTRTEISHGYVMAAIKGSLAAPFWFASGVSPEIATLLTVGVALNEFMQTRYMRTLDNIYLGRTKTDPDFMTRRSAFMNIALRSAVSLGFSYLWRSISGPVGAAHSVRTLQGNAELFANMLAKVPGAWLGTVKATRLTRAASSWVGFIVFGVFASMLNNADITGIKLQNLLYIPPLKIGEMVVYQPSTTLVILFGTILTTTMAIKYGPAEGLSKMFEALDAKLKRMSYDVKYFTIRVSNMFRPSPYAIPINSCTFAFR